MRILYIPHYSSPKNLNTCSVMGAGTTLFKYWLREHPNDILYWAIDLGNLKAKNNEKVLEKLKPYEDRIKLLDVDSAMVQSIEQNCCDERLGNLFNIAWGHLHFDCLWCDKPLIIPEFLSRSWTWPEMRRYKVVVGSYHYFMDNNWDKLVVIPEMELGQIAGAINCDYLDFMGGKGLKQSETYGHFIEKVREHLASHYVQKALDIPYHVRSYVDFEECEEVRKLDIPKNEIPTVQYGFGINEKFHFGKISEVTSKLARTGYKFKFLVTTSSQSGGLMELRHLDKSVADIHYGLPRKEFYKKAATAHAFIWWYNGGRNNNSSTREMIYQGVVGIYHQDNIPYHVEDDYPYTFKTKEQLMGVLKYVLANYYTKEMQELIKEQRDLLLHYEDELWSPSKCINKVRDMFHERTKIRLIGDPFRDLFESDIYPHDEWTMDEVCELIKRKSARGYDLWRKHHGQPLYLRWARDHLRIKMYQGGYEDIGDTMNVRFKRLKGA